MTDTLWAPWRMKWISAASKSHRASGAARGKGSASQAAASRDEETCLFCRVARSTADRRDLVLARRPHAMLMLNRYPYASAHLMVAVQRHTARFVELETPERADLLDLVALAERALEAEYRPDGVNYGLNVGRVAGAGFPGHLHMHLVPRWNGDTNFMPVIGRTRVLPESLAATWGRLRRRIAKLEPARGSGHPRTTRAGRRGQA